MKKIYCFALALGYSIMCNAQVLHEDNIKKNRHFMPFDTNGILTLSDYITKKWPNLNAFKTRRSELLPVPLTVNIDSTMFFWDGQNQVEITFGADTILGRRFFSIYDEENPFSASINSDDAPYGVYPSDTIVKRIKSLSINGYAVDNTILSDVLNPNQYYVYLSVKPVEVYHSKCGNYLFLYFCGEIKPELNSRQAAFDFSYMAKYIFEKNGQYKGRIIERGAILKYFGFDDNPFFKGF